MENKNVMMHNDNRNKINIGIIGVGAVITAYILKKHVVNNNTSDNKCFGLKNTDESIFDFEQFKREYEIND